MIEGDIGRKRAIEYELFGKPAELLANRVPADNITALGFTLGVVGSRFLAAPEDAIKEIEQLSGNMLYPTRAQIKIAGGIALATSYVCDLLDGAVARKSRNGETFHGTVFDGMANKLVDTTPALIFMTKAQSIDERVTWLSYIFTAPMASMIRSRGIANSVPVPKTGFGARVDRVPILLASLFKENSRNSAGKVLTFQAVSSAIERYRQIRNSGNSEAIAAVNKDLLEYTALFIIARAMGTKPLRKELLTLGLELAKLGHVKLSEARTTTTK